MWAVHVEIAGQRQADSFLLTSGDPEKPGEITVGRPPAKADRRPDIIVPEKSVSKIHAVLRVSIDDSDGDCAGSRLVIEDRSRFGTAVNGQKIEARGSRALTAGDVVQLAPRTLLIVERLSVALAAHPGHPQLDDVREAAARAGIRLTHAYDSSTTHVLYEPGDVAWSALAQGALRGVPLADLDWLRGVASAGLLTNSLPSPPPVSELLLGPARPAARAPLPPPARGFRGLLEGFTFGYSVCWQDEGLAALLVELGGRVAERPRGSFGSSANGPAAEVVVELTEGGVSGGAAGGCLRVGELLTAILTMDAAGVRQRVASVRGAAAGSGRLAAATDAAAPQPKTSQGQADSDMTQAAEDDEEAEARGGEVVEQRPGPRAGSGAAGAASRIQGQAQAAAAQQRLVAAPDRSVDVRAGGPSAAGATSAREAAAVRQDVDGDGWLVAARRPEDAVSPPAPFPPAEPSASTEPQPAEHYAAPEEAPAPKRRRLTAAGTASRCGDERPGRAAAPAGGGGGATHPPLAAPRRAAAAHFPVPAPAATPLLLSPLPAITHDPVEDAPWITHQPHGRSAAGSRSGVGLRGATPPAVAVAIKEEAAPRPALIASSTAKAVRATKAGRASGAAAAAAAEELGPLGLSARGVKEEAPGPELLDASAQVVLEADLFAATPEQLPQRCRSGSVEPYTGSGGMYNHGGSAVADAVAAAGGTEAGLPDFKQFRKQGAQLPPAVVQPLPVVLVDNFQRTDEAEAFLRLEEERAANKRRADEMFKRAEQGSKKPPRAPRRG